MHLRRWKGNEIVGEEPIINGKKKCRAKQCDAVEYRIFDTVNEVKRNYSIEYDSLKCGLFVNVLGCEIVLRYHKKMSTKLNVRTYVYSFKTQNVLNVVYAISITYALSDSDCHIYRFRTGNDQCTE